jgi:hypothetical protein
MKKIMCLILCSFVIKVSAQETIQFPTAKFSKGDHPEWKNANFDDGKWTSIKTNVIWEFQGYADYNGVAWYRFHFYLPSSLKNKSFWKDSLRINLAKIDDVGTAYINGEKIGQTGSLPEDKNGYQTAWNVNSEFHVATNNPALHWDGDNVLAVRVYDGGGGGGIFGAIPFISMMDLIDGVKLSVDASTKKSNITVQNQMQLQLSGKLLISLIDPEKDTVLQKIAKNISLNAQQNFASTIATGYGKRLDVSVIFIEQNTGKKISVLKTVPYILTPVVSAFPKINAAKIFGVRPGSPVIFKIAATGEKPLQYAVKNLPKGLLLDNTTGIITGSLFDKGDYKLSLVVTNAKGKAERDVLFKVGDVLALTPPMGWNSWNCWGLSVSTEKVKSSAQALIDKGLIDHGWSYINIDDGWEQPKRDINGNVLTNAKFPDMKLLGDWLHTNGLKFGIYSSPGPLTCGGYLGSYQYEMNDANSYNKWGIDYLKYDWCSYENIAGKDTSLLTYQKPYSIMRDALRKQPRDIVFSLCQYGMKQVWKWGHEVNGNCWRTTGDIEDTWESMSNIGFSQTEQYKYTQPGRWSDPDMLVVGMLGWGENLHPTRLTPDEQYTHVSLWSLLAAPLLIGCDISKMDDFTLSLLSNDEVIAVNQDVLGKEAKQIIKTENYQVWMKELEDGTKAVGIFNLNEQYQKISLHWSDLSLASDQKVRDLWRQKNLGVFTNTFVTKVPPHGVSFIKLSK